MEHHLAQARAGRFGIERLMFYLARVPAYVVVAEIALNQVLCGDLPHPAYPDAGRLARAVDDAEALLQAAVVAQGLPDGGDQTGAKIGE